MFPILIYAAVTAFAVVTAQAFHPSEALRSDHHRRLYWTGAAASIGIVSLFGAVLIA